MARSSPGSRTLTEFRAHGTYQTYQDPERGLFWWVCSCGITAAHGRASRRGARRDGDKHLGRAITNRPSKRERIMNRAGAPGSSPLEAGGAAEAIGLPSERDPVGESSLEIKLKPALQLAPDSPRKPLVLVWHGEQSE